MLRQMSQEDDDVAANLKELFADLLEDEAEEADEQQQEEESGNQPSWVTDTLLDEGEGGGSERAATPMSVNHEILINFDWLGTSCILIILSSVWLMYQVHLHLSHLTVWLRLFFTL